jgi:hypothetical protein
MRWLLLGAALLSGPVWGEEASSTPEMRAKLSARLSETLPPAPAKKPDDKPAAKDAAAVTPAPIAPAAVARAGRPIPRLSAETMQEEWWRLVEPKRKPAAAATAATTATTGTAPKKEGAEATDPDLLVLPTLEVTAQKLTELEARVHEIDRRQRSEEKAMAPTWVDTVLDLPVLRILFGGHSAESRAATAQARVEVMRWERVLQAARELAKTPEEKAQIDADIRLLGEMTRYWP